MPDVASDVLAAMADFGETVILPGGRIVLGLPSVASVEDSLNGDSIVPGRTRTIRFQAGDVAELKARDLLSWSGKTWAVNHIALKAAGRIAIAFLGAP